MTGYIKLYREQLQAEILKNPQVLLAYRKKKAVMNPFSFERMETIHIT